MLQELVKDVLRAKEMTADENWGHQKCRGSRVGLWVDDRNRLMFFFERSLAV